MVRKDAKAKVSSNAGLSEKTMEFLDPQSKAEFQENFVELTPFSTGMLIYNYFLYTVWTILSVGTIFGVLSVPAWAAIVCFSVSYMRQSMWFILIHLDFHLLFIVHHYDFINKPDENKVCNHLGFMAWRHHYHKTDTFTEFWLRYRMSYFDYRMWTMIVIESVVEYALGFKYWWLNAMFQHTWIHIEAVTHEWYHVPLNKRKSYFRFPPVGWFWFFMEWIGMINTNKHMGHHGHEITNQLDCDDFFDMWVPAFMLRFADNIWETYTKQFKLVEPITAPKDHPQFTPENQAMYHKTLTQVNFRNYLISSAIGVAICYASMNTEKLFALTQVAGASLGVF